MNNDSICWQSNKKKKKTVVGTSTPEAEYRATFECTKKVLWIRNTIKELYNINKNFFKDNLSSKTTIENSKKAK